MTGEVSDDVAKRVHDLRQARRLSIAKLADQLPGWITANAIENIEYGRRKDGSRTRRLTVDELVAFAEFFSVSADSLLYGDDAQVASGEGLMCTSCLFQPGSRPPVKTPAITVTSGQALCAGHVAKQLELHASQLARARRRVDKP